MYDSGIPLLSECKDSLDVFRDKPFWLWSGQEHNEQFRKTVGQCCFNRIIGKPVKNNKEHPLYDYKLQVIKAIEEHNNIFIKRVGPRNNWASASLPYLENIGKFRFRLQENIHCDRESRTTPKRCKAKVARLVHREISIN
jgi:hypothetical protein